MIACFAAICKMSHCITMERPTPSEVGGGKKEKTGNKLLTSNDFGMGDNNTNYSTWLHIRLKEDDYKSD